MKFMRKSSLIILAAAAAVFPAQARAAVVANFGGGNDSTFISGGAAPASDTYQGIAGSGWTNGWNSGSSTRSGAIYTSGTAPSSPTKVINTSPLKAGSGNYLSATFNNTTAGTGGSAMQVRNLGTDPDNGAVYTDATSASPNQTIHFSFRLDSAMTTFTGAGDYVEAFSRNTTSSDFDASGRWGIRAYGASPTGNSAQPGATWLVYQGANNNGAFSASNFISTGIALTTGTVYDFTINTNTATKSYMLTLSDGTNSFTSASLKWAPNSFAAGAVLHFGGAVDGKNASGGSITESVTYSLDNISVVPEPAVVAGLATFGLLLRRRRK